MPAGGLKPRAIDFVRRRGAAIIVLAIVLAGVCFRLTAYGDLRLSVGTMDTDSYQQSARVSPFSWAAFTGQRLYSTNLLYRIANAHDCPVGRLSAPATGKETQRALQDCFDGIVVTQAVLSVLGWAALIGSVASMLSSGWLKIASALILTTFAFVPQVADWDSILSSESLTFSMFALSLAFIIQALRSWARDGGPSSWRRATVFSMAATASLAVWTFTRDANVYTTLILGAEAVVMLAGAKSHRAALAGLAVGAFCLSAIAFASAAQSERWKTPLGDAMEEYVLPYPARVASLQRLGMPTPGSTEYQAWFDRQGPAAYAAFLLSHPGFLAVTITPRINAIFAENNQPYFKATGLSARDVGLQVGDIVHAKSSAIPLLDAILVLALLIRAIRRRTTESWPAAGLTLWLLLSATTTFVIAFFADPIGVERHVLFALTVFRLLSWIVLFLVGDITQDIAPHPANA